MAYSIFQLPFRLLGDAGDYIRAQKNFEAAADAIAQLQMYANTTGTVLDSLLSNVVASSRLGAQIAGFGRPSTAYKQDGTQVAADLPRFEKVLF